jgi:mono/diheme cytochrome c family protein
MPHSHSSSPRPSRRAGRVRVAALATTTGAALVVLALAHRGAPLVAQDPAPTFARDVAPILYKNCATCHRPGGIGPFSVLDYDTVRTRAPNIRVAVSTGHMPPWHAEAPRGTFLNDRRLSDADKSTILRWVAGGAKLGDLKALPPRPVFPSTWEIGEPDAVVAMPEAYVVPARGTIEYQYFEAPTDFTEDKWVQAIEIRPGARGVVHHVLVFARAPAAPAAAAAANPTTTSPSAAPAPRPVLVFDANQKITEAPRTDSRNAPPRQLGSLIGTTAPGTNVLRLPEGTALRIRAGSVLTFQMHYTAHGHEEKDRTAVGFRFAKEPPAEQMIATNFYNGQFVLPPGAKDVMIPSTVGFNEPVRVYGLFPHTHVRGTRWQYTLEKPDGSSEVILDVPRYNFNWQTYYLFARPLEIPAGARIVSRAWYDNSAGNPNNPDPTIAVRWGDQTWEEMQYTGILYTVNSRRLRAATR